MGFCFVQNKYVNRLVFCQPFDCMDILLRIIPHFNFHISHCKYRHVMSSRVPLHGHVSYMLFVYNGLFYRR